MGISRKELEAKLVNVENKDEIINYIMSENGKSIEELKAKNYELEEKFDNLTKEHKEYVDNHSNYDDLIKQNEELNGKVTAYEEAKKEQSYYDVLKELNFDNDFINKDIFNRIDKGENIEAFKNNAQAYLKEHPKFSNEETIQINHTFDYNNLEKDLDKMSDEELLKELEKQNN